MSKETLQAVSVIKRRLRAAMRRITLADILYGFGLTLSVFSLAVLVSVAVEAGFWFDTLLRTIVFWAIVSATIGLGAFGMLRPLLRHYGILPGVSEEAVARRVGFRYPDIADRLVNLLQLAEGRRTEAPGPMVEAAISALGKRMQHVPFDRVEDFGRAKAIGRLASLPIAGLLVFVLIAPSTFLDASGRLLAPDKTFERPAPFALEVAPGSVNILRGDPLPVTVRATGSALPRTVVLEINNVGENHVEEIALAQDSSGLLRHTIVNLRETLRYRAKAESVATEWFTATVDDRPIVRRLDITLRPPAYTHLPVQKLPPNVGDILALPGAYVHVYVLLGEADDVSALLRFDDGHEVALSVEDAHDATGGFILRKEGSYTVILRTMRGVENADPITYTLQLLEDAYPTVNILDPTPDAEVDASLETRLELRANDDYGLSRLAVFFRLAESRFSDVMPDFESFDIGLEHPEPPRGTLRYHWRLTATTKIDMVPGDVIEYYAQVWDNDAVAGFKAARSSTHRLRLPSLAERYAELAQEHEETETEMETLLAETESIREQFEELRDELRQKRDAARDDGRQLESLSAQQQELEERIDALAEKMQASTENMEDHGLVSEETLEMFEELQRVTEEINAPELMEALRELQQAMEDLSPRLMQEAIEKFEFNEEMFRDRLERSLELFKRLQIQQQLEEAANRAEDLADQQEQLSEATEREEHSDDQGDRLADEQLRAKESMETLEERMEDLEQRMEALSNTPEAQMEALNEQTSEQQIPEHMQQNAEMLRDQKMQQARQGQQQMRQQLQQLQGNLQDIQSTMQGQQQSVNIQLLRRTLMDILSLSHDQEAVRKEVGAVEPDGPLVRGLAQRQLALSDGLSVVSDSVQRLSNEIPQMTRDVQRHAGVALQAMAKATGAITDRSTRQAIVEQQRSMEHLNELALLLTDLLEQLMNASGSNSGGGMSMDQMIQQLQQMAGQQQQLNQQLQEMLNQMQGQRLSTDMQERLQQMGAQQQNLRHQLREMSRQRALSSKLTGDLDKIAEQMLETIKELQGGSLHQRTKERQQQILTRLLDASRSMYERGKQKKRERTRGEDIMRDGPGAQDPAEQAETLRQALLEALESGYAPDYRALIRRYFELLQRQE